MKILERAAPVLLLLVLLAAATAGCGCGGGAVKDGGNLRAPDISGNVISVDAKGLEAGKDTRTGTILVDGEGPQGALRASIRVTDDTSIEKRRGDELSPAKFTDLREGLAVEVWFTGPVAESYPVQATASEVRLLD